MYNRRPLLESDLLLAMSKTKSNAAAARWLGVGIDTYRKYAKRYICEETGKTLWEKHKNVAGKGIKKAT